MLCVAMAGVKAAPLVGSSRTLAPRRLLALRRGQLVQMLALALVYYAVAHIGYAFEFAGPVAAIVWLPVGVAIAFLYLGGIGLWPGVLVGDLLVNDYSTLPIGSAVAQTLGNVTEALVATLLMRLMIQGSPLGSVRNVARMVAAIGAGAAVSATVGSLSLVAGDVLGSSWPDVWRTWLLGDFAGALIVVPLAVAWAGPLPRRVQPARAVEAVAMVAAVACVSEIAFRTHEPVAYLVFPPLIWAALRFGARGATVAITVAVGFAIWNTTHSEGPFVFRSISHTVLTTQLYLAVAALSTLFLVAVVTEREAFRSEERRVGKECRSGREQYYNIQ